jgi:hypothetical protein
MDWSVVASLATAAGTLVLAIATFASVRSAQRAARVAERSLLAGLRPLLLPSRSGDRIDKVSWIDQHYSRVPGGQAVCEVVDGTVYLAAGVRNAGTGVAVLHGWRAWPDYAADRPQTALEDFRRLGRDLYIAGGDVGFWQGALREEDDGDRRAILEVVEQRQRFTVDILYGDFEGGQRTVSRFGVIPVSDDAWLFTVARHWNIDRDDPR